MCRAHHPLDQVRSRTDHGLTRDPTLAAPRLVSRTEGTAIARIDDLTDKVESRFHLVHLAAKRAREINGYYAQLGEGMGAFVPPLLSTESNKPLSIALEEIAERKIEGFFPSTDTAPSEDPLAFIEGGDESA